MTPRKLIAAGALGALAVTPTAVGCLSSLPAHALSLCGGNQNQQVAPITCTNSKTFTVSGLTRTVTIVLDVHADGAATVAYTVDKATPADIPIKVRAHVGISSSGDIPNEAQGVIPAGALGATLAVQIKCGQIDIKAVFIGNGDANGRVGAPYVTTADNCGAAVTSTTVPQSSTSVAPTSSSSVPPPPTTTPASTGTTLPETSTAPTTPSTGGGGGTSSKHLPATGTDGTPLVALAAVFVGLGLLVLEVRRRSAS